MRVLLNLARAQSPRQRYVAVWAPVAALVGLAGLVAILLAARADYRAYHRAHAAAAEQEMRANQLRERETALTRKLQQPAYLELGHKVEFLNLLIDQKKLSMTGLMARVADLLPPHVRLTNLAVPDAKGQPLVRFGLEAADEEQVEMFLGNLENAPDFQDVTVISEGFEQKDTGGPAGGIELNCAAHYLGGNSPAPAPKGAASAAGR